MSQHLIEPHSLKTYAYLHNDTVSSVINDCATDETVYATISQFDLTMFWGCHRTVLTPSICCGDSLNTGC